MPPAAVEPAPHCAVCSAEQPAMTSHGGCTVVSGSPRYSLTARRALLGVISVGAAALLHISRSSMMACHLLSAQHQLLAMAQAFTVAGILFIKLLSLADWCRFRSSQQLGKHLSIAALQLARQPPMAATKQMRAVWSKTEARHSDDTACKFARSRRGKSRLRRMSGHPAEEKSIRQKHLCLAPASRCSAWRGTSRCIAHLPSPPGRVTPCRDCGQQCT